jgi:hypothetical protein
MMSDRTASVGRWLALLILIISVPGFTGEALAASGSTRLSISIDQSVVDAIARWKGEPVPADRTVPRGPGPMDGLAALLQPRSADLLLQGMRRDALVVFPGDAEHAGPAGGAVSLSAPVAGNRFTVHSI